MQNTYQELNHRHKTAQPARCQPKQVLPWYPVWSFCLTSWKGSRTLESLCKSEYCHTSCWRNYEEFVLWTPSTAGSKSLLLWIPILFVWIKSASRFYMLRGGIYDVDSDIAGRTCRLKIRLKLVGRDPCVSWISMSIFATVSINSPRTFMYEYEKTCFPVNP